MLEYVMNVGAQSVLHPATPAYSELVDHSSSLFILFCTRSNKISQFAPSSSRSPRTKTNAVASLFHSPSLFRSFCTRSNKISHLVSTTCTLFFTLKKISHLFSHSSQKYPGVGGGIVSLPAISRDNQLRYTPLATKSALALVADFARHSPRTTRHCLSSSLQSALTKKGRGVGRAGALARR